MAHVGDGVAVGHQHGQDHGHLLLLHLDVDALGEVFLARQLGNVAAQVGGQTVDAVYLQSGGGGDSGQDFLRDVDISQFIRMGHVIFTHGGHAPFGYCTTFWEA